MTAPVEGPGVLLDLVQQYGDVRFETGTLLDGGARDAFMASRTLAETLFTRIAALIPQQPVQARDEVGMLVWQDGCGSLATSNGFPTLRRCPECNTDATWRPLLVVGGDPAPEQPRALSQQARDNHAAMIARGCCGMVAVHVADCPKFDRAALEATLHGYVQPAAEPQQPVQALHYSGMPLWLHTCGGVPMPWTTPTKDTPCANCGEPGPWRPLFVGGDPAPEQPSLPGSTVGPHRYERGPYAVDGAQVCGLCGERRAAAIHRSEQPSAPDFLAAVNKLEMQLADVRRERDELDDRAANALAEVAHLRVELAATEQMLKVATQPAEPGSPRLTLPETAVVRAARRWYREHGFKPGYLPRNILGSDRDLKLAVEQLAPPREPRTWPKLDGPPDDMLMAEVEGLGVVFHREERSSRYWRGGALRLTWAQMLARGKVKEVKE